MCDLGGRGGRGPDEMGGLVQWRAMGCTSTLCVCGVCVLQYMYMCLCVCSVCMWNVYVWFVCSVGYVCNMFMCVW